MATRMQQRRGTASQWTTANPILAAGELGYETDTGEFRVGDGVNTWDDLSPFKNIVDLGGNLDDYVLINQKGAIDGVATLNGDGVIPESQLALALASASDALDGAVTTLTNDIATAKTAAELTAAGYVDTHASDTTNVHGIADTSVLVTATELTSGLAGKQDTVSGVSSTEIGYLDGVTSSIQTQLDAKASATTVSSTYAPLASPELTGVPTAPTASAGTSTTQVATTAFVGTAVADLVASAPGALNTLDELAAALGDDVNFATTVTNSIATKAPIADPTFTGLTTVSASGIAFTDGTQLKQGVPSLTAINQQAAAYTPVLADRDKLVEVSSASGVTVTIPTNASVAYPVGTSIDILQTGAGQVTVAGAGGVTVNATPGLKLRAQWSSATLFKRATDTWVVFGDLSA